MFFFSFGCNAYGILASQPGIEPTPPALEAKVLTTGPPGKSLLSSDKQCSEAYIGLPTYTYHISSWRTPWNEQNTGVQLR